MSSGGSFAQRTRAYAVHLYTASGVLLAFFAAAEIAAPSPDPRTVFLLFAGTVLIDASDGPFARRWEVKRYAARIDGRTIDDIVDYLTYTFLPLLLIWRMGWVPDPAPLWVLPPMVASLFGFANTGAKDEERGFFLGFPSYWNVVALYAGIAYHLHGGWINAAMLLALAALTFAPVGFIYPNLAPRPWKVPVLLGAVLWLLILVGMVIHFPHPPGWMVGLSLLYPAFYTGLSLYLRGRTLGP
jgi:phosphatidylcholine synthase